MLRWESSKVVDVIVIKRKAERENYKKSERHGACVYACMLVVFM